MIEAEEARLKTEIDGIVAKINATMKNIESVIPKDEASAESTDEDRPEGRIEAT
jgi:hypothetical protein